MKNNANMNPQTTDLVRTACLVTGIISAVAGYLIARVWHSRK